MCWTPAAAASSRNARDVISEIEAHNRSHQVNTTRAVERRLQTHYKSWLPGDQKTATATSSRSLEMLRRSSSRALIGASGGNRSPGRRSRERTTINPIDRSYRWGEPGPSTPEIWIRKIRQRAETGGTRENQWKLWKIEIRKQSQQIQGCRDYNFVFHNVTSWSGGGSNPSASIPFASAHMLHIKSGIVLHAPAAASNPSKYWNP